MKKVYITFVILVSMFLGGCNYSFTKDGVIDVFRSHKLEFENIVEYMMLYDYLDYKKSLDETSIIYSSFAVSDFNKLNKYNMLIESGSFKHSSDCYEESNIPDNIKRNINSLFDLNVGYICYVDDRCGNIIVYFRFNDDMKRLNNNVLRGIVFSQNSMVPHSLFNDIEITIMENIVENWYYYEQVLDEN